METPRRARAIQVEGSRKPSGEVSISIDLEGRGLFVYLTMEKEETLDNGL